MIFRQWEQVLDGTKTQTRRLVKERDYGWAIGHIEREDGSLSLRYSEVCSIDCRDRDYLRWQLGRTYAVQPNRGKKAVGRFKLLHLGRERLWEISEEDAKAEGVSLRGMYGLDYIPGHRKLGDERGFPDHQRVPGLRGAYAMLWDSINRRGYRWENNPVVWVLSFEQVGK